MKNTVSSEDEADNGGKRRRWRDWHERETAVRVKGSATKRGIEIQVESQQLNTTLDLLYPNSIWQKYPKENKVKLLDNITYIFTAHFPFLLKGNIRLEYNTGYPQTYAWAIQCFTRFLPAYWYVYRGRRGTSVTPLIKTLLNSRAMFAEAKDVPPKFPSSVDEKVVIPFTFGKDSFISYHVAKELGIEPTLVYFNEPTEAYARKHKLKLIEVFKERVKEKVYFMDNPLGNLREFGEGWFGWELALTSWALLSLPFAYANRAGYIVFSNEKSVNDFFYDENGLKVQPDYEQTSQATEALSMITQALSEGEVYTTNFLNGLNDLGIIAILKDRYAKKTFPYLMSCWAETPAAKNKRWCGECSKCARLYIYLLACGVDPVKEAGFVDNMLTSEKAPLYNVFGNKASGTGWDAFGLNVDEQSLAFYLAYLRGNRDRLTLRFYRSENRIMVEERYEELVEEYFGVHNEEIMPKKFEAKIRRIYDESLARARREIGKLRRKQ